MEVDSTKHPDDEGFAAKRGLTEAFTRRIKAVHIHMEDDPCVGVVAVGVGEGVKRHGEPIPVRAAFSPVVATATGDSTATTKSVTAGDHRPWWPAIRW